MKKLKFLIILVIVIFSFNWKVSAASGALGVSTGSVYVGDTFTVTASVHAAAAWSVRVTASGPVSGCAINQADATADAMDTNKVFSATCTATGTGTIYITLSGDATSAADGLPVAISGSRSVTVSERPAPTPTPSPSPTPAPKTGNNSDNNKSNNSNNNVNNNDNKSNNNNIKELKVDNYELTKIDNNQYVLSVSNNVTNINVTAGAEDEKARVVGTGKHDLNVGENIIELVVVSESGLENKITLKVIRKDGYYLEDLDLLLKDDAIKDINITIGSDTKVSSSDLKKIKESKKVVKLNFYNEDKSLLYGFTILGAKVKEVFDFLTIVQFDSEKREDILKLSNYADGLYFSMKHGGKSPKGTSLKLFVGNKYNNKDIVNVYSLNSNGKLVTIKTNLKVKDGYIEFATNNDGDYFVTKSKVNIGKDLCSSQKEVNLLVIIPVILVILAILSLLAISFFKKRSGRMNIFSKKSTIFCN